MYQSMTTIVMDRSHKPSFSFKFYFETELEGLNKNAFFLKKALKMKLSELVMVNQ